MEFGLTERNPMSGCHLELFHAVTHFIQLFTPIMYCQWQGLNTTVLSPLDRGQIVSFDTGSSKDASRRPL